MQRVLTFVHNQKKYVSKPWCFGAATLVEKEYMDVAEGEKVTATSVCADAVDYLFEGTEATQDILDTAVSAKMRMCREVMKCLWTILREKTRKACRSRQPKRKIKRFIWDNAEISRYTAE